MTSRPLTALVAAALLGAAVPAAAQAPVGGPVVVTDAADVRAGQPDLRRVSLQRAKDGRLRAALTFGGALRPADLLADSGPPGSVCLKLWTTADPPDEPADRLVCVTAQRGEEDGDPATFRASVLLEQPNALPQVSARAVVSRSGSRTLVVRFSQASIGRPAALDFQGEATRAGCPRTSCVDLAPDAPTTARLRLRKAASTGQ